jgi:hypothetical protein
MNGIWCSVGLDCTGLVRVKYIGILARIKYVAVVRNTKMKNPRRFHSIQ